MNETRERETKKFWQRRSTRWTIRAVAIIVIVALWGLVQTPHSLTYDLNAVCRITTRTHYDVVLTDGDTLRLSCRTGQATDDVGNVITDDTTTVSGCFVSEAGHVVTSTAALSGAPMRLRADSLHSLLRLEKARLGSLAEEKTEAVRDLDYYARTHSVTDDGYNDVMAFREQTKQQAAHVDSLLLLVDKALACDSVVATLRYEAEATLTVARRPSEAIASTPPRVRTYRRPMCLLAERGDIVLMQQTDGRLPALASHFSLWRTGNSSAPRWLMAYHEGSALSDALDLSTTRLPKAIQAEGGALTDDKGRFCGILTAKRLASSADVRRLCFSYVGSRRWWLSEVRTALRRAVVPTNDTASLRAVAADYLPRGVEGYRKGGTHFQIVGLPNGVTYLGRIAQGRPEGFGEALYPDSSCYVGQWRGGMRQGRGTLIDTLRRTLTGQWQADTLAAGLEKDSTGIYCGQFNRRLEREGTGIYHRIGAYTYVGDWHKGQRHGFGFAVGERRIVQAGIWQADRFRGEQMIYTAARVYGIDISRYQHEQGRRRYAIDFSKLRITHLGAANASRIRGVQDYPVSFVYIKASQGIRLRNRYYAADAAACRRRGIPVGAYHFFTTNTTGQQQAQHFLRTARPRRGDLPPVLDVEPTERQIAAMGGREAMFREMAAWVKRVEAAVGTRPVLYVSQTFVNRHMAYAPASLTACPVWIARYGEYKPYVHLLHWQLSPRGRVRGIRGDVDINVFNGDRDQFAAYVRRSGCR